MAIIVKMPGRKGRRLIEGGSNIIKRWFKHALDSKLTRHFKKVEGIPKFRTRIHL